MQILIIGAGAAGCFAAIELKRRLPKAGVTVVEAQRRPLAKVAITGGGRCNLTNSFATVKSLEQVYPRGARLMKRLFREFDHLDTLAWFEKEGVRLVTQEDECVFPAAQDARVVIHCLLDLMEQYGVRLLTNYRVTRIIPRENGYTILPKGATTGALPTFEADSVIVATGGSPRVSGMAFLDGLDLSIVPPVPSLFGLSLPDHPLCQLTGTVVENVNLALAGTKIRTSGPLLITHRGISGPAVLKLSSHAARLLAEADYQAEVVVNWAGEEKVAEIAARLLGYVKDYPARQLLKRTPPFPPYAPLALPP